MTRYSLLVERAARPVDSPERRREERREHKALHVLSSVSCSFGEDMYIRRGISPLFDSGNSMK